MDIATLSINMDKDPSPYINEFRKQISSFEHLLNLNKQPEKLIRQTMDFLLRYSNLDSSIPSVFLESVRKSKTMKLKNALIAANLTLTYKKLIKSRDFIKLVLDEVTDCPKFIYKIKTIIQESDQDIILEYYNIGNEKQKLFCYFFICFLSSKYKLNLDKFICTGLFDNPKVRKYCYTYFLETMDMSLLSEDCKKYGDKLYKEIVGRKDEREFLVYKMKVFVLFRTRFNIKNSVMPLALSMIDPEKPDVKDLMNVIVDSVNKEEVMNVVKIISETFCSPFKDDDMICYGLGLMRGIYIKFDKKVISSNFDDEDTIDDEDAFDDEDTCDDEDTTDDKNTIDNEDTIKCKSNDENNLFCETLKECILNYVECFKGLKNKSIAYAYRSVINVLKNKKNNGKELAYIHKKLSKEEKREMYAKKYTKEERKELFTRKSKRKFKLSKKRIRKNKK